jgi:metal-dependent hydrolase (beta-lactamase superfamily II)
VSTELDTPTVYMKLYLHLEHMQNLFFVNKLLLRHGHVDHGDLLICSYELVALTVKFWAHKDRFGDAYIRRNFDWFV